VAGAFCRNTAIKALTSVNENPNELPPQPPGEQKAKKCAGSIALAMELPFTIVGAVVLGGLLGFFLDHWLHTKVVFTLLLGGVGFAAGLKEVLRRLG
jgi:F0F1-type ATP synthase assembly protein I